MIISPQADNSGERVKLKIETTDLVAYLRCQNIQLRQFLPTSSVFWDC
ncbi:hypothetical protein [Phormidium nigroviride]